LPRLALPAWIALKAATAPDAARPVRVALGNAAPVKLGPLVPLCYTGKMSIPLKHHHSPVFYLDRWTREDGMLCQFSRPYNDVVAKRKHPEATGYVRRLYEMPGLPPEEAQQIEQTFMQPLDTMAAEALAMLEANDPRLTREAHPRSAWSRFMMSLLMRTPEDIAALKSGVTEEWARAILDLQVKYAARRGPNDPPTIEEYMAQQTPDMMAQMAMSLAPTLIDHRKIGKLLNNMRWLVVRITSEAGEFLTSDRPVLMTSTLTEPNAYVMLPIGPKSLFVAVNDTDTQRRIEARDPTERVEVVNRFVAGHAVKYVYGRDDSALDHVRTHMGAHPRTSLLEQLTAFRKGRSKRI
jgi:Protein of unknown function (DUF4238)